MIAQPGVGGINGRPLQIGGVLDGQKIFVERGGIGVLRRGGIFRVAQCALLRGRGGAKSLPRGGEGGGLGIGPAFELERGKVRGLLNGGDDDVGAGENGAEVGGMVDAHLKFLMQFHGLAGKGEPGGLARLVHAMEQCIEVHVLGGGEVAEFTLDAFLSGKVGADFGEQRGGAGQKTGGQSPRDIRIRLAGGDDDVAVVDERGYGEVRYVVHCF